MKISVQFEADSIAEAQAFFSMFHVKQEIAVAVPAPAPVESVATLPQPPEIQAAVEAPVEALVEKPKRGRPFKAKEEPKVEQPVAQIKPEQKPIVVHSRQDLLDTFAEYVQKYGANFGYLDVSSLLQKNLGNGVRKASDVKDEDIPKAIGAIREAISQNPYNRTGANA